MDVISTKATDRFEWYIGKYGADHYLNPQGLWLTTIRAAIGIMWDEDRLPERQADDITLGLAILVTDLIHSPKPVTESDELIEDVSEWLAVNYLVRRGFKKYPLRQVPEYRKIFTGIWYLIDYLLILLDQAFDED